MLAIPPRALPDRDPVAAPWAGILVANVAAQRGTVAVAGPDDTSDPGGAGWRLPPASRRETRMGLGLAVIEARPLLGVSLAGVDHALDGYAGNVHVTVLRGR